MGKLDFFFSFIINIINSYNLKITKWTINNKFGNKKKKHVATETRTDNLSITKPGSSLLRYQQCVSDVNTY